MGIQRVSSKWTKTAVLQRSRNVNGYIPVTRQYSRQALERMTELFESNYIKPDRGTYGNGVMRVKKSVNFHWQSLQPYPPSRKHDPKTLTSNYLLQALKLALKSLLKSLLQSP